MSLSIVEILEKKGSMTDLELQKELKSSFGEVSFRELNTGLMKLELAGVLWVSRLMRGKRQVELTGKPVIDYTLSAASAAKTTTVATDPKCAYCVRTGRWTKGIFPGKRESVYCPHCHGSGKGGVEDSSLPGGSSD